ncbi:MAG: hypothetical protein ACON39_02470 [Coraliomargaritaceae bacterium]
MKYLTAVALFLSSLCAPLFAALSDADIIRLMDEKPVEGYDLNPADYGLPATSSGFIILNYDDAVIDGIWRILDNPEQQEHWKSAFIDLRRIITADPKSISFEHLKKVIIDLESNSKISGELKTSVLTSAYGSIARFSNESALEFIKVRVTSDFWQGNEIERNIMQSDGKSIKYTGQTEAIIGLAQIHTPKANSLLANLSQNIDLTKIPHLNLAVETASEYYRESDALSVKSIKNEYAKRLEIRGDPNALEDPDEVRTAPQQASQTNQKPKTPKAAPEPPSKTPASSQSWLWLMAALLVLAGCTVWALGRP